MSHARVTIQGRTIGEGEPVYIIGEIGINHNGSVEIARQLIRGAKEAGADMVKFQKRTPELCVPKDQWYIERDTPWGRMTYIDYRHKIEFGQEGYAAIDRYCKELGIDWTASCWDEAAIDFMEPFNPPFYKMASASLTDLPLLRKARATGRPLMLSTGMSTLEEILSAVEAVGVTGKDGQPNLLIAHSTGALSSRLAVAKYTNLAQVPINIGVSPGVSLPAEVPCHAHTLDPRPCLGIMITKHCPTDRRS